MKKRVLSQNDIIMTSPVRANNLRSFVAVFRIRHCLHMLSCSFRSPVAADQTFKAAIVAFAGLSICFSY